MLKGIRLLEFITFYQNPLQLNRVHCGTFYQSALRHEQNEDVILSFGVDSSEKVCSNLSVKRCEGDRDWLSQLLLLFLMQYVKVCKSGQLIVTSYFKVSMSFLSSLASVVEFLNQMKRNHRY